MENPEYIRGIIHPEDKKMVEKWHNKEAKIGNIDPMLLTYRIILPDSSFKWIESVVFSSGSLDGKPIQFEVITDITDKKEKEMQNNVLRYAMDRVDKVVWVGRYPDNVERAHKNFKYFYVNDAVYDMFGLPKEEFSRGKWVELVCPEYKKLIDDHARNEIPFLEFKFIHKITGEIKWINAILYKHGDMQFGFISDVTKQKEKEFQNDMLRYAMDRVDKIVWIGHFPDSIKKAHKNFEYFYVNDAIYDVLGLTKEEFSQGKWVELVCPEYKKLISDYLHEEHPYIEYKIIHKITREEKWLGALLYKHENMYFGFVSDVTKQKKEELAKLNIKK